MSQIHSDWPDKITCPICGHDMIKSTGVNNIHIVYSCNMGATPNLAPELHDMYVSEKTIVFSIFTDLNGGDVEIIYQSNGMILFELSGSSIKIDSINLFNLNELRMFI